MTWIDGPGKGAKGIVKSGDMFTTLGDGTVFQFSWVAPRTGSQDGKVKQGLDEMDTGDGDTQTGGNGEACVGFAYNNPGTTADLLAVQFAGLCECRVLTSGSGSTFSQGDLMTPSATAGRATMETTANASDSFGIQLNDYNIGSGYILAKVNATEKY